MIRKNKICRKAQYNERDTVRAGVHKTVMPQKAIFAHLVQAFLLEIQQVFLVVKACKSAQISSF